MKRQMHKFAIGGAAALALAACNSDMPGKDGQGIAPDADPEEQAVPADFSWPESVAAFGDGYPEAGDPCRKLGEAAATVDFLDDSAQLVGCPTATQAQVLGGKLLGVVDGVTLVSVPMGDANVGMQSPVDTPDAKVAGTDYNATTILKCGFDGKPPTMDCNAGVKRNWGEQGEALVEVTKPDGRKRAIFVRGTTPYSADSAQADGSAGWDFTTTRKGDMVTVKFGPETYVIVDALIEGG